MRLPRGQVCACRSELLWTSWLACITMPACVCLLHVCVHVSLCLGELDPPAQGFPIEQNTNCPKMVPSWFNPRILRLVKNIAGHLMSFIMANTLPIQMAWHVCMRVYICAHARFSSHSYSIMNSLFYFFISSFFVASRAVFRLKFWKSVTWICNARISLLSKPSTLYYAPDSVGSLGATACYQSINWPFAKSLSWTANLGLVTATFRPAKLWIYLCLCAWSCVLHLKCWMLPFLAFSNQRVQSAKY